MLGPKCFTGVPASVIVTPKEFFSNEPLHTIKCKADIGYPFGKVVLRISYDEGNNFENYFVSKEKMDVQASADCYKLVLVNFTGKFEFVHSVSNICFSYSRKEQKEKK